MHAYLTGATRDKMVDLKTGDVFGHRFEFRIGIRTGNVETSAIFVTAISTRIGKTILTIRKASGGRAVRRDSALYASVKACATEALEMDCACGGNWVGAAFVHAETCEK